MRRLVVAVVAGLALAGCGAAPAVPVATAPPSAPTTAEPGPTRVTIPAIGVDSTLIRTGMLDDPRTPKVERIPEVPDVRDPGQASWASWSPEPGAVGPAVLLGHVDGEVNGKRGVLGVFARIRTLQPGQQIVVDRADGTRVTFLVDRVQAVPKASLDLDSGDAVARQVYGDVARPELRLISCGGSFDHDARNYRDQVVVSAHLVS